MNRVDFPYKLNGSMDIVEACYRANYDLRKDKLSLSASLPLFLIQLTIVLLVNSLVTLILKPIFRQPLIFCQLIAGVLLGPSGIGDTKPFKTIIFPFRTATTLETFANLGVVFHMFLVGLKMDLVVMAGSGRKVISIALAGILVPMVVGLGLFFIAIALGNNGSENDKRGCMFWALALTATNSQELTQILSDLKLLGVGMGRLALSSSCITDFCTFILLTVAMLAINKSKYYGALSTLGFVLFCVFIVRPSLVWMFHHSSIGDHHIWFLLAGILLCGLVTDGCGVHSSTGAFVLGMIMPQARKARIIKDRLNDFINSIWMPIFFLLNGFRSNLPYMFSTTSWKIVLLVIMGSCSAKMISTFLVSLVFRVSKREALALGLLMNTKGVLTLIVLNTGRGVEALDNQTFPLMILALLVMIFIIEPILSVTYKPTKQFIPYKHRTVPRTKQELEFRILVCVHSTRNLSAVLNLVRFTKATNESPINVFAVHLVELIGHSAAMLIVHDTTTSKSLESEQVIDAFEDYQKTTQGVSLKTLTCISSYEAMPEDIFILAEEKHANLVIIPFHLQFNNTALSSLLVKAPCSVGIFVERGNLTWEDQNGVSQILMLMPFIGGPDDREALAYAWRMAGHPNINLKVVRFLLGKDVAKVVYLDSNSETSTDYDREKQLDEEDIYEFKFRTMNDDSISYIEKVVNNAEDTTAAVNDDSCDLYIVGIREGMLSTLMGSTKTTSSELGIMGDILASHTSVLVMQQYDGHIKDRSISLPDHDHEDIKYDAVPC